MIQSAVQRFGRLDVVINNAGILHERMLVNMTEAEWDAVITVHLKGTFGPAQRAAAYWRDLVKQGQKVDARIINTTSVSGICGNAGQTNYGAAKAGIAGFTIIAARELRRYGITVNAIAPGALTRLTEDLRMGQASEADKARMHPRWIAPIVTWLASRESAGLTGRVFEASGAVREVAEGWHRGPTATPVADPIQIGPVVTALVGRARKNAGMNGEDLDERTGGRCVAARPLIARSRRSPIQLPGQRDTQRCLARKRVSSFVVTSSGPNVLSQQAAVSALIS